MGTEEKERERERERGRERELGIVLEEYRESLEQKKLESLFVEREREFEKAKKF